MKTYAIVTFTVINLLSFSSFLFGQEMTPQQKLIIEKIEQQNKVGKQRQNATRKQLGLDGQKKTKTDFFWENGIGLTTKDIEQKRKTDQYIEGGHIDCREWGKKDALSFECESKSVRNFIWKMWSEKKRGYITQSGDSVDALATAHIFIESDKKGNWQIVWRIVRWSALPGSGYSVQDFPVIISVERIEDKSRKEQWNIILKNKSGKIFQKL